LHDPKDPSRVGIEVEFTGMTIEQAMQILQRTVGGKIEYTDVPWNMIVQEPDGTLRHLDFFFQRGNLKGSRTRGPIVVKPEYNDTSGVISAEAMTQKVVIELLTHPGPIRFPGVVELQKALTALQAEGAIGTRPDVAVSLQVNVEIANGQIENLNPRHLVHLLRNYNRPEHHRQIRRRYQIPKIRWPYIQPLSEGFLKRLMDPSYDPTLEQLKDDAIYRQLKELLGDKDRAWSAPIEEIRAEILKYVIEENAFDSKDSPLFRVIKFSPLKFSSLLLYAFPKDPMAEMATKTLWIKLIPAIEFRERNNDFDVISAVKQSVGMVRAAEIFGSFLWDRKKAKILSQYKDADIKKMAQTNGISEAQMRRKIFASVLQETPDDRQTFQKVNSAAPAPSCRQIFAH
jgi:hypothetical protein